MTTLATMLDDYSSSMAAICKILDIRGTPRIRDMRDRTWQILNVPWGRTLRWLDCDAAWTAESGRSLRRLDGGLTVFNIDGDVLIFSDAHELESFDVKAGG